jgi:single-stranded DNA-binding protein
VIDRAGAVLEPRRRREQPDRRGTTKDRDGHHLAAQQSSSAEHARPGSPRREQEPSFFTVVVWRDQAEHAAESLTQSSRVEVVGRLQQRTWTAEDGGARQVVEVVAEELGPSLRWATATPRQ